ncbi:serine hydrolase domain-containing protein [Thermodesulfobacteriota bacterium]
MKRCKCLSTTLIILLFITGCTGTHFVKSGKPSEYWPTEGWRVASPESQGIDSNSLVAVMDTIREKNLDIHSLMIIRRGYVVLDAYFYPYTSGTLHDVASVTKSITSTLIGIAIDHGFIQNVDETVLSFFPEKEPLKLDERKRRMTVSDLLSMTSGFDCGYTPAEAELFAMLSSDDWVQFVLDLPMAAEPGAQFGYCSGGTHLLSAIIARATGITTQEFANDFLFEPLGIRNVMWPTDPQGINHGWGDLRLNPHDMAKIGYLYLNEGFWEGRQVISADWIKHSTKKHADTRDGNLDYGYGWWVFSSGIPGLYEARGRGGQAISVWPEKDIVAVFTGSGYDRGNFAPLLISSIKSDGSLPENPEASQNLQEKIAAAVKTPPPEPTESLPESAYLISGRFYQFEYNSLDLQAAMLNFKEPHEAGFSFYIGKEHYEMPIGLDGVYRISPRSPSGLPVGLEGYWPSENEFVLNYHEIAGVNNFIFRLSFEGDAVQMTVDEKTGYFDESFGGQAIK